MEIVDWCPEARPHRPHRIVRFEGGAVLCLGRGV